MFEINSIYDWYVSIALAVGIITAVLGVAWHFLVALWSFLDDKEEGYTAKTCQLADANVYSIIWGTWVVLGILVALISVITWFILIFLVPNPTFTLVSIAIPTALFSARAVRRLYKRFVLHVTDPKAHDEEKIREMVAKEMEDHINANREVAKVYQSYMERGL